MELLVPILGEDQEVQLEAALGLGPDTAEATLREIACAEHSADPLAARAIVALDRRMTREQLEAVLNHALRTRRVETARTCLEAPGQLSIAQGQGGELSLAGEDPEGRLSIAEDGQ